MKLIIAKYRECLDWIPKGTDHFIVEKEVHLPNEGRESLSYIWYILENWDTLEGNYVFLQGNPFPHWMNCLGEIPSLKDVGFKWCGNDSYCCTIDGTPQHSGLNIGEFVKDAGIEVEYPLHFIAGGQFAVSADNIKGKGKDFWEKLRELHTTYAQAPWIIERLWGHIFNE